MTITDALYNRYVVENRSAIDEWRKAHPAAFKAAYPLYRVYKMKRRLEYRQTFKQFQPFTMLHQPNYMQNLELCDSFRHIPGSVVECGTWKGGMIAGIAKLFDDDRAYYLFDSFEGLPPATNEDAWPDGYSAIEWQKDLKKPEFAHLVGKDLAVPMDFAVEAMSMTRAKYNIVAGWFNATLPLYRGGPIAILRVDGDFYDSVMDTLKYLYPLVSKGGLIILDDYYYWQGATKAVHDYLSMNKLPDQIRQFRDGYAYIIKG